ncbi:DNA-binding response regulator [Virgisporangium aliadipatigenens]|uniref:DNA-binding response regulator n=1 Tax=Virgisporangium aliadipatigenens TaxID=741659 RepID=A0A8J3YPM0_9ACTN|nr:response regulator transcription factor [Virgisporangium aliadipatigenens]GIJ47973.1 DNA-binding response regulator [Virgisporangium aliadipatigenens]
MIRVLVADDEALIRAGIRMVLETADDIEIVAEAGNGVEAVDLARRHRADVALLDIRMPALDGLAAAAQLATLVPRTRVVMLTTFGEEEYVARALRGGAAGFLLKDTPPDDLIGAVRVAAAGEAILSPRITRHVIERYVGREQTRGDDARRRLDALTGRERDVLALVADGASNAEIARSLHISEGTAKAHVSRILTALGCTNRVQAAIVAHDAAM